MQTTETFLFLTWILLVFFQECKVWFTLKIFSLFVVYNIFNDMDKKIKSQKERRSTSYTQDKEDGLKAEFRNENVFEGNNELLLKTQASELEVKDESLEDLKTQLETLTNSLAVLSAEKSRMEANFQIDKKQSRNEREEYEKVIQSFKEKLKRIQVQAMSEVEHLKYKLIMERHEREKEQSDHSAMTKEMQKLISAEQKSKEQLESQITELRNIKPGKGYNRILESEIEVLKNKLKHAETIANETSSLLKSLQQEMAQMKKKHKIAMHEEQKRVATAEQEVKTIAATYESRVAGLEARLTELSQIVGGYDRLRQQDQKAIHGLKEQLVVLQDNKKSEFSENSQYLAAKIKELYFQLLEIDKKNSSSKVKDLLNSLKLCDENQELLYKEKYESTLSELEELKKNVNSNVNNQNSNANNEAQLQRAKSHNKNLEEKLRMLITEFSDKEQHLKLKIDQQQEIIQEQYLKMENKLIQKENEYLNKIGALEQQLLLQRERSLGVIQEKDKEIDLLKSSFEALIPRKNCSDLMAPRVFYQSKHKNAQEPNDFVPGYLNSENNPPMIFYTQELARKEVQISNLRKQNVQMESALRESEGNYFRTVEKQKEDKKKLEEQIKRLEAYKSREGANLEYLKNVVINYLTSKDTERKRHMLNAISTVLKFTPEENDKISKQK